MLIAASGAVIGDNIGCAIGHHYGRAFLLGWAVSFSEPKRSNTWRIISKPRQQHILVARLSPAARLCCALSRRIENAPGAFLLLITWPARFSVRGISVLLSIGRSLRCSLNWVDAADNIAVSAIAWALLVGAYRRIVRKQVSLVEQSDRCKQL